MDYIHVMIMLPAQIRMEVILVLVILALVGMDSVVQVRLIRFL